MSALPNVEEQSLVLVIYHSRLFKAHWSVLVPDRGTSTRGTRIHVSGSLSSGFEHEIIREYDVEATGRSHSIIPLGTITPGALQPTVSVEPHDTSTASNRLEEIALETPAPGPSLRSSTSGAKGRIEVQDCQFWVKRYVAALVEQGILSPAALDVLATAPEH
ncbi:hypothetical protein PYCCODRAFT_1435917 [Trametes coccinea BRFM310]|uniref:Uncharacterized protein n=1 Tax=Trametes coccinea (strain BRFM310) TaxID=1353009 RepID=A0A1Y2ILA6_TRAC3|nr:hypothetical protein PYCCODRAFT_1435917 [Trametes coccinea BRFM310]